MQITKSGSSLIDANCAIFKSTGVLLRQLNSIRLTFIVQAQYIVAHPSVTTKVIKIHLIVVTNLLFVMPMRIPAEYHQIISYQRNERYVSV